MKSTINRCISYQFKWRFIPCAWLIIFLPLTIYLGLIWIFREGLIGGLLFIFIALFFVLAIGILLIMNLSDVEIDEKGISRKLLNLTWQRVRWIDVKKFHISNTKNPANGQIVRVFIFVSKKGVTSLLSRRIIIQENASDMENLVIEINFYISKYQIAVEDLTVSTKKS